MNNRSILKIAAQWINEGRSFVSAVVTETNGSSPQVPGSHLLIDSSNNMEGTVGGGDVEFKVLDRAKKLLKGRHRPEIMKFDLAGSEGPICGGNMSIFLEPYNAPIRVIIFGAGHVSSELCPLLHRLGFSVHVFDSRPERLDLPEFACANRILGDFEKVFASIELDDDDFIITMTPSHTHDYDVIAQCIQMPWYYFGVMSSKSKKATILKKLHQTDVPESLTKKLAMPIGLEIPSRTPAEIAVAIAGQLIAERAQLR